MQARKTSLKLNIYTRSNLSSWLLTYNNVTAMIGYRDTSSHGKFCNILHVFLSTLKRISSPFGSMCLKINQHQ